MVKYLLTSLTFPLVGKILTFKGEVEAAPSPTISADDLRCHCGGIGDIKPARVRALDRGVNLIIAKSSRKWKVWKGSGGVLYATPERWEGLGEGEGNRWVKVKDVNTVKRDVMGGDGRGEGRGGGIGRRLLTVVAAGDPGDVRFGLLLFPVRRRRWV